MAVRNKRSFLNFYNTIISEKQVFHFCDCISRREFQSPNRTSLKSDQPYHKKA